LRRSLILAGLVAALVVAGSAAAAFQPIKRTYGDLTFPRVRAGTVKIPAGHAEGLERVIVTLSTPPLAAAFQRGLYAHTAATRLNVALPSSRAYLARVQAAQAAAIAQLHAAIPSARVSRRFSIILDGITVTLPAKELAKLVRLGFVAKVYPSYRYSLDLNESPGIIQATQLEASTGASGAGIKIGVVDDGIDQTNPFFNPAGYQYPPGFPRGNLAYTTPKVIVARAFAGPGSGKSGELPLDPNESFHGTHVSGIAAGNAGTTAPAGDDHPTVTGLSGVAPKAWLGNYRVFDVPTPFGGDIAETPEIIAAFEAAVADGMNVINFSGGGAQTDPSEDAMIPAITNTVAAGVVPVIAAGNDRDDFGLGTVGSPGTAPDAISVAAVSNLHVFGRILTVDSPQIGGAGIPFEPGPNSIPTTWATVDQKVVDVGSITGTDGKPVDRLLCGPSSNPEQATSKLPAGSLAGSIALVERGTCTFTSKAERAKAAGAIGIIISDNRAGEANPIPVAMTVPGGMIADLDGARLRAAMAATGGKAQIKVNATPVEIQTGRGGIPTSFSSAGPTDFGHLLKPDISAPGGQILSSTTSLFAPKTGFAVFDGTSMATPHITGAAALLLQLHPYWSPAQVKSALMSTAGPAYADTGRTTEAPVLVEGAGLAALLSANDPRIFTDPESLSFQYLDVTRGAVRKPLLVAIDDAGNGAGDWQVSVAPQSASAGAEVDVPGTISLGPGGEAFMPVVARAAANATPGDDYGFVVLTNGSVTRRIPYYFSVTKPGLASAQVVPLQANQVGDTSTGTNRASVYRWPQAPFGPGTIFAGFPPTDETGAEKVYSIPIDEPAVNFGVAVLASASGAAIDPWVLGSLDENDVQGYAGTPVNVNNFMFDYRAAIGTAGAGFPSAKTYYVSVDSPKDEVTGKTLGGKYFLHAWVNDLDPPLLAPITTRVAAGRPTLVVRTIDLQSGVDPLSLVIAYGQTLVGAAAYDPVSGLAVFPLPPSVPALKVGTASTVLISSDYQEAKNVATLPGPNVMPNTAFVSAKLQVVNGPALNWLAPENRECVTSPQRLLVVGSSTRALRSVAFSVGGKPIAVQRRNSAGLFATDWTTKGLKKGTYELTATLRDAAGKTATQTRTVRVCK
jgi:subtilisin family serine protease